VAVLLAEEQTKWQAEQAQKKEKAESELYRERVSAGWGVKRA
jgi:hypothetical protein